MACNSNDPVPIAHDLFGMEDPFQMQDENELFEVPMESPIDNEPPDEFFEQLMASEEQVKETGTAVGKKKKEARKFGVHGRRRAKDTVARQAGTISKANQRVLQAAYDNIDTQPRDLKVLPYDPIGVARVPPEHPWAKIHASHELIVVHNYAACHRCGIRSSTNCTMKLDCRGYRKKPAPKICGI